MPLQSQTFRAFLALLLLAVLWGYNWVVMKHALGFAGAFQFGALRTSLGALCLLALLMVLRRPMRPREIPALIVLGLLQTSGFTGLIIWALVEGGAGKTAVLTYTMPFWVMVLAWPLLGEKLKGSQWLAAGLSVLGLLFILDPLHLGSDLFSMVLALLAGVFWALSVIVAKKLHQRAPDLDLLSLTAWQMLVETAHISDGSTVLITGATGGVGHLAVQIAKALGAHVTAVVSAQNAELARTLGADAIIDYTSTDFSRQVQGLDVVFDVIGADYPLRALDVLRPGGMLISTLPQSLGPSRAAAAERGLRVAGVFVESDRLGLMQITELVVSGTLTPLIAATFPLERADQAHSFKGQGKVVLEVP